MKITRIELHLIRVPFDMGAVPQAFAGMAWTSVDTLFVRVCTDAGVDGWGEGWGHVACPITASALATLVGPAFIGRSVDDRAGLMAEMAHRFHIHGRSGAVVHALAALWHHYRLRDRTLARMLPWAERGRDDITKDPT